MTDDKEEARPAAEGEESLGNPESDQNANASAPPEPATDAQTADAESDGQAADAEAPVEVSRMEIPEMEGASDTGDETDGKTNLNMILDIPVDLHVELGSTSLSIREVLKLGSGSIVELERLAGNPADIVVNGKHIGQGDVVVVGDNFGIRITKLVDPEKRIDSL